MNDEFESIRNHHEAAVIARIRERQGAFSHLAERGFLPDVACVALNRLPARYIRHAVDFSFYLSEKERADTERLIADAVEFAFEFVQARVAMRARS
jgi:hypothetical protein